jgi:hypothetical protein
MLSTRAATKQIATPKLESEETCGLDKHEPGSTARLADPSWCTWSGPAADPASSWTTSFLGRRLER